MRSIPIKWDTVYRCKNVVEPYISKQWFVKKEFAKPSIEKVNGGEAKFFPPHWINSYNGWMGELRDWCISRQLWWGHRIPVFYCRDCNHEWVEEESEPKQLVQNVALQTSIKTQMC